MNFVKNSMGDVISTVAVQDIDKAASVLITNELVDLKNSFVLDLQDQFSISSDAIRELVPRAIAMRDKFKIFYLLHPEKSLKHTLRSMGLESLLKCIASLNEVDVPNLGKKTKKIDVEFLNPFIEGTIDTLQVQCSTECEALRPLVKNQTHYNLVDIAGVIGITSIGFNGSISIGFPEKTFVGIISSMLGEEYTEITKDVEDAAGELLNIIFGHAKKKLNESGHSFQKAIPTVVRGDNIRLKHLIHHQTFVLPFKTKHGMFYMEISSENND